MFIFKKIVGHLFFPLTLCLEIFFIGIVLLLFTKKQKTGKVVISIGFCLALGFSYKPLPELLLGSLENKYPPLISISGNQAIYWVVVLGGGYTYDQRLPANSQLANQSLVRLIEGVRIYRQLPMTKMILSGGSFWGHSSNAEVMLRVAVDLGVEDKDIVLESLSKDTKDEAFLIKEIVGNDRFILVTSASHMHRSMLLFKKLGMVPIPAPADFFVKEDHINHPLRFYPSVDNIKMAERAFYEYMGLAWAWVRGQV